MKLKCVIVDDETLAQNILQRYIKPLRELELVAVCKNAIEANSILQQQSIDLLFLDIEMPHISGLNFLKSIASQKPKVIITTAYREHALTAFDFDVIDYMLKPISYERFVKGVNKVLRLHNLEELASQSEPKDDHEAYIYLKADKKMVQIFLKDIFYVEGLSNYVKIFTKQGMIISYQKISYLEEALPSSHFIRVHRSYIVSMDKIKSYTGTQVEVNNVEIPLGGSYKDAVLATLNKFER
ncbi:MAG: response regulator transcription factor [Cyclobacteriaceae bacterium]|nr:response regulator transcription factor [Cyclobacteriaceae bacterium]